MQLSVMLESEVTEVTEVMASGRRGQNVRGHPPKLSETFWFNCMHVSVCLVCAVLKMEE